MNTFDKHSKYSMRDVIGNYMKTLGENYDKVTIVNADLMGTCRNGTFVDSFPGRAFNVGIAEQNMVSFAAGLAHEGFMPYVFSMAPFITMRACEQCRTDVAYAGLNVRLMGTYAGYSGGISGATHWALEDCAIMTSMDNMTVIEVCDPYQAVKIMELSAAYDGPMYIRSGVEKLDVIYNEDSNFKIGKASIVRTGDDGAFICSGITVSFALKAACEIEKRIGKKIRVIDMFTLKPIDKDTIIEAAKTGQVVVAQDHNKIGGLGQMVATVIAESGISTALRILGCNEMFETMAHADYLYHKNGYDVDGLITAMLYLISNKK